MLESSPELARSELEVFFEIVNEAGSAKLHNSTGNSPTEIFVVGFTRSVWTNEKVLQNYLSEALKRYAHTPKGKEYFHGTRMPAFKIKHVLSESPKKEDQIRETVQVINRVRSGLDEFYDFVGAKIFNNLF